MAVIVLIASLVAILFLVNILYRDLEGRSMYWDIKIYFKRKFFNKQNSST